jgi:hypothetical protein
VLPLALAEKDPVAVAVGVAERDLVTEEVAQPDAEPRRAVALTVSERVARAVDEGDAEAVELPDADAEDETEGDAETDATVADGEPEKEPVADALFDALGENEALGERDAREAEGVRDGAW